MVRDTVTVTEVTEVEETNIFEGDAPKVEAFKAFRLFRLFVDTAWNEKRT